VSDIKPPSDSTPEPEGDITQQIVLRLPKVMVQAVDRRAKNLGLSRNQWYENMTRWVLKNTVTVEKRR
jgi:predicted HicB family RNase H-like nuclease